MKNTAIAEKVGEPAYSILIPEETRAKAALYLQALRAGTCQAGVHLRSRLKGGIPTRADEGWLLGELIDTKFPQIFAESAVAGDGSDWTSRELGLLGDVSVGVPVTFFDNGHHTAPIPHDPPFAGTLVFTPGALLRNGLGQPPADWEEVTTPDGTLSQEGFYGLYRRRLLPVFQYINARAARPRQAIVTVPGLGCGQFAGPFQGRLGPKLEAVLERFLLEFGPTFPNLKAVYFDPYGECSNTRKELHGISWRVRPLRAPGNATRSQLCRPEAYAETGDDFSSCALFSLVAWDHVSWPGNDFFVGARATDDGVKAAASSSMTALTGVEGHYDRTSGKYLPPKPFRTWEAVVEARKTSAGLRLYRPALCWKPTDGGGS